MILKWSRDCFATLQSLTEEGQIARRRAEILILQLACRLAGSGLDGG